MPVGLLALKAGFTSATAIGVGASAGVGAASGVSGSTADGSNAPAGGAAQLSGVLSGYAVRPSWNVAGIDYAVGIHSGTSLTDWQSLSGTGISVNTGTGRIDINGTVTINGVDFSLHGGSYCLTTTNNSVVTFTNCKFGVIPAGQTYAVHVQTTNCNLILRYCEWGTSEDWVGFQASGNLTLEWNYIHAGGQHPLEQVSGTVNIVCRYNLYHNNTVLAAAHNNWLQWGTIGSGSTVIFNYNTSYHDTLAASVDAGEGPQFYANGTGTLSTADCSNNTFIAKPYLAAPTMSNIVHGAVVGSGTANNNYFDTTGCSGTPLPQGAFYTGSVTAGNGWTFTGNKDMTTNTTITPA